MFITRAAIVLLSMGAAAAAAPSQAETIQVSIDRLVYLPAEIEAKVGDEVEWINRDALVHTATVEGGADVLLPANNPAGWCFRKRAASIISAATTRT